PTAPGASAAGLLTTDAVTGEFLLNYGINGLDFDNDGIIDGHAYATGPFRGISSGAQGYYQFLCMDKAYDIRAQLRLFVRDWDRSFDVNTDAAAINRVSDYYKTSSLAKIDSDGAYDGSSLPWNNFGDWDDFLLAVYPSSTS